jgi:hypothetical protein
MNKVRKKDNQIMQVYKGKMGQCDRSTGRGSHLKTVRAARNRN